MVIFNEAIRAAMGAVRPTWPATEVCKYSSNSFRVGAATTMVCDVDVQAKKASAALSHLYDIAINSYLRPRGEEKRSILALGFVR